MVPIAVVITALILVIIYSHSWFMSMLVLTPLWLGITMLYTCYLSLGFVKWIKKRRYLGSATSVYSMSLFLIGLMPLFLIQIYSIVVLENSIQTQHIQICIQFYMAVCILLAAWFGYREKFLGESARINSKTIRYFYLGLSLLFIPITIFRPDSGEFIQNNIVYFLYVGLPNLMLITAVFLLLAVRSKIHNYCAALCVVLISCNFGVWWHQSIIFYDFVMIQAAMLCVSIFFIAKYFKEKHEETQLSAVGKLWEKPKFLASLFNLNVISFFAITIFCFFLLLIVIYLPTKKAFEHIHNHQVDHHIGDIVEKINHTIEQNEAIIDSVIMHSNADVVETRLIQIFKVTNELEVVDKVEFRVVNAQLTAILTKNVSNKDMYFMIDIDIVDDHHHEDLHIEIEDNYHYKYVENKWMLTDPNSEDSQYKKYYIHNLKVMMDFEQVDWIDYININKEIYILMATIVTVIYFLIYFKYSSIINSYSYMATAIKETAKKEYDANLPVEDTAEIGVLSRAILDMQQSVKEDSINLEQEILIKNEVTNQLYESKEQAIKANQSKTEFLSIMSHEIRTPMNGVIGLSQLMAKTKLDLKQKEYVSNIIQSGEMLLLIINDILDISKIESKTLELNIKPINIKLLILQTIKNFDNEAKIKRLEILVNFKHDFNFEFSGDELRLKQIISNLISNAIKFTNEGFVLVEAGINVIENQIEISVIDSGVGIPKEKIGMLFENFTQEDSSNTRKIGGIGLGLSISKNLVNLMGGNINAYSSESGSTFTFNLPVITDIPEYKSEIWHDKKDILIIKSERKGIELYEEILSNGKNKIDVYNEMFMEELIDWSKLAEGLLSIHGLNAYDLIVIDFENKKRMQNKFYVDVSNSETLTDLPILVIKDDDIESKLIYKKYNIYTINKPVYESSLILASQKVFNHIEPDNLSKVEVEDHNPIQFTAHILVVEDTHLNQVIVDEFLRNMGMEVTIVDNGEVAIKEFIKGEYDLILMDCLMPVMDGFEATASIRELESKNKLQKIPIIALTANALTDAKEQCISVGMDDFLSKPFIEHDLIEMLKKWLPKSYFERELENESSEAQLSLEEQIYTDLEINPIIIEKLKHFNKLMGQEKLNDLITKAIDEIPRYLYLLIDSKKKMNSSEMIRSVHSLKSMSANFSFTKMSVFCHELEEELKNNTAKNIDEKITELNDYCFELIQILQEVNK